MKGVRLISASLACFLPHFLPHQHCVMFIWVNSGPAHTTDQVTGLTQGDRQSHVNCFLTLGHFYVGGSHGVCTV